MNSARKSFAKPPRASGEGFENIKAAKEIFCDLTYQIRCLNELYNQLTPQSGNRRASSSAGDHQDGGPQRDPKVLQQLRLLKANLRSKYLGNPLLFSSLEHLKVVVMFDGQKQPFFDFRLRPVSGYPTGYPFLIDDNEGTIAGLSEVIYLKVLKAVQEEKESRGFGEGNHNNNNNNNNNNSSHAAEEGLIRVNIKQEVEDDEEEELITLEDDSDDESFNDELHQEENYNSQAIPPANTAEQQHRQQPVSRRPSERQSGAPPIKLEPSNSSIATITRVNRPPINPSNRAPRTSSGEAPPAAAAASVAVPPAPAAAAAAAGATPAAAKESTGVTIRVIQVNPRAPNTTVFPSKSKPQPQQPLPPAHHHHNNTKTSAQQLQQQPPAAAAAAAAEERGTLAMKPTAENSSIYRILGSNNNKRPADSSTAAQPQGISKRAKTSTAAGTSSSSSTQATKTTTSQAAIAERFLASADFRKAADGKKLPCPICEKSYAKAAMSDHLELAHTNRAQYVSYRCTYPGCTYTNVWGVNVRKHVQREHGCRNDEQYIEKPAAAAAAGAVVPKTSTSAAAAAKHRVTITTTTTTTPTTASTTSTSTPHRLSAEDYLRAHCPAYVAAKYASTRVKCPDCPSCLEKRQLKDHILSVHRGLKPYHCRWQGCSYTSGWRSNAAKHVKDVHKSSNHAQYIVLREEE